MSWSLIGNMKDKTVPGSRTPPRQDYHGEWDSCRDKYQISSSAIRGGIQNFLDWCRHLYSSCGSGRHQ